MPALQPSTSRGADDPWTWPWLPRDWAGGAGYRSEPREWGRTESARPGTRGTPRLPQTVASADLPQSPASALQVGPEANGNRPQTPGSCDPRGASRGERKPCRRRTRSACWQATSNLLILDKVCFRHGGGGWGVGVGTTENVPACSLKNSTYQPHSRSCQMHLTPAFSSLFIALLPDSD